jgi:SAM-dependent methyltransferase
MDERCYLCDGPGLTTVRDRLRHGIQRRVLGCARCGLQFLEPRRRDMAGYHAREYRQRHGPVPGRRVGPRENFELNVPQQARRVRLLAPYLRPATTRVLDVGCSTGEFLWTIRNRVRRCVGIELDPAHAEFARRLGLSVHAHPLGESRLAPAAFDVITAFHVFEHLEDPLAWLAAVRRHLAPGGVLCIEVPCLDDPLLTLYRIPEFADFWYREPHLFNYDGRALKAMLAKGGFTGRIVPLQDHGLVNHLHWASTRTPQASIEHARGRVELIARPAAPVPAPAGRRLEFARRTVNRWVRSMDARYRRLLERLGVTDGLVFIGRALRAPGGRGGGDVTRSRAVRSGRRAEGRPRS